MAQKEVLGGIVAVVSCIDLRMQDFIHAIMRERGMKYFLITRAGAGLDLLDNITGAKVSLVRDISVALEHGADRIMVIFHEDCKAMQKKYKFSSPSQEMKKYREMSPRVVRVLQEVFPGIPVEISIAPLLENSTEYFDTSLENLAVAA